MNTSPASPGHLLVVIAGPTAVGKTELAIRLAERFGSEILSADSRQFYKEMNIGTAKPGLEQLQRVKHHFINTKSVTELYGAGHFAKDALERLPSLFKSHQVLFLVGGSGLYIKALLEGVDDFEEIPPGVRDSLNREYREKGLLWLQEELKKQDPVYHERVDLNNPQRLLRALEVMVFSGKPYSSFLDKKKSERFFSNLNLLIDCPRETLYQRINSRVDEMMKAGFLDEVKSLKAFKLHNALKTVGYKELDAHLEGKYDLDTAIEKIKQHTRNYAKRQLTWFRNQGQFQSFAPEQFHEICDLIESRLRPGQQGR